MPHSGSHKTPEMLSHPARRICVPALPSAVPESRLSPAPSQSLALRVSPPSHNICATVRRQTPSRNSLSEAVQTPSPDVSAESHPVRPQYHERKIRYAGSFPPPSSFLQNRTRRSSPSPPRALFQARAADKSQTRKRRTLRAVRQRSSDNPRILL